MWMSDYPVDDFTLSLWPPTDITQLTTDPALNSVTNTDGTISWNKDFGALSANKQFALKINYNKTSDRLTKPGSQSGVQPSQPIGSNTPGRIMLSNYLPDVIVCLGLLLMIGGGFIFGNRGAAVGTSRADGVRRGLRREAIVKRIVINAERARGEGRSFLPCVRHQTKA